MCPAPTLQGDSKMKPKFDIQQAVFTYFIGDEITLEGFIKVPVFQGMYYLYYTPKTQIKFCSDDENEIGIIGFCVDAHGELSEDEIANYLLQSCSYGIEGIYQMTNRLAGRYVICCSCSGQHFIIGDATGTLPVCYTASGEKMCISSLEALIASVCSYSPDPDYLEIRNSSDYSQPMPYDLTVYREIKVLLPNHYYRLNQRIAVRCSLPMAIEQTDEDVISDSDAMIRNITQAYTKQYQLICPLTSGYDSRVVFAYLKQAVPDIRTFVFRHPGFTDKTDDLWVPETICTACGIPHDAVCDETADVAFIEQISNYAGDYICKNTVHLAVTYLTHFSGYALINGDIIDQVGKSLIGNSLSTIWGSPSFFQCKLHNHSTKIKQVLAEHLEDMSSDCKLYRYDLFAMENRCGRWASQGGNIYALCGIVLLNIFNCRELICKWVSVPRKKRVQHIIHEGLLKKTEPMLLSFPFNPSGKYEYLKKNPISFLLATYAKYIQQNWRKGL